MYSAIVPAKEISSSPPGVSLSFFFRIRDPIGSSPNSGSQRIDPDPGSIDPGSLVLEMKNEVITNYLL
jgi:hypothetical protein